MKLWMFDGVVLRESLHDALLARGYARTSDAPATGGARTSVWEGPGGVVILLEEARSGAAVVALSGDDGPALEERLRAGHALSTPEAVIAASREALPLPGRVRALLRVASLTALQGPWQEAAYARLCEGLTDEARVVREVVLRALFERGADRLLPALTEAAARFDHLAPFLDRARASAKALAEGTLNDGPTDDWNELLDRARAGVAEGQWGRVARAMDDLLSRRVTHAEGNLLRALAYEQEGDDLMALAHAAVAVRSEYDVTAGEGAPDDALERRREELVARVRARVEAAGGVASGGEEERLVAWFKRGRGSGYREVVAPGARAVREWRPERGAWLDFFADHRDADAMRALARRLPDSPSVAYFLARVLPDGEERAEALRRAIQHARSTDARTPAVEKLEALQREVFHEDIAREAPRQLAALLYGAERWAECADVCDEAVAGACADDFTLWRRRAAATIFALRHEAAVGASQDALAALDRFVARGDGPDDVDEARGTILFNLSCVYAKLGRRQEALDALRRAGRCEARFLREAAADDYWEAYWGDEEFLAVSRGDAAARVCSDERDAAAGAAQLDAAARAVRGGDVGRGLAGFALAAAIFEGLGDGARRVEALLGAGAATLAAGDAPAAARRLEEALALQRSLGDRGAAPAVSSELALVLGQAWLEAGDAARAEAALEAGLREAGLREAEETDGRGDGAPMAQKFLGELSRADAALGRGLPEQLARIERGLDPVARWAEARAERDKAWADAVVDLSTLATNGARIAWAASLLPRATELFERAVGALGDLRAHDWNAPAAFVENLLDLSDRLRAHVRDAALRPRVAEAAARLDAVASGGDPALAEERRFWRAQRAALPWLRRAGMSEADIVGVYAAALRGVRSDEAASVRPELASLPADLARRVAAYPTFGVLAMMAFDVAAIGTGTVEKCLDDLEALCVGGIHEAR